MIQESLDSSFYEVLDVKKNATPEAIREAYLRAKNAFANDSLATYSLFDKNQSRKMLEEIESAYSVLSDPDKRRRYDHSHGFIRSSTDQAPEKPQAFMEFGVEVSEVGMRRDSMRIIDLSPLAVQPAAQSQPVFQSPVTASSLNAESSQTSFTPPRESFAARYLASQAEAKPEIAPLSKSFVPSASMNPNAHFIHKKHEPIKEIEDQLKSAEAVDGGFLKRAREYRGVSLDEMMEFTKLTRRYIEAIEKDDINGLPAPVYVRGFIMQYAKALQLDASRVAASYMRNFQSLREARGLR